MALTAPIPVRLSPDVIHRLDEAAKKLGNTRAGVIKLCLAAFLEDFEARGTAALPLDWQAVLAGMDGRSTPRTKSKKPNKSTIVHAVDYGPKKGSISSGNAGEGSPMGVEESEEEIAAREVAEWHAKEMKAAMREARRLERSGGGGGPGGGGAGRKGPGPGETGRAKDAAAGSADTAPDETGGT